MSVVSVPGPGEHLGGQGVGHGQGHLDQLDDDAGEEQGQGELHEKGPDEHGRALAVEGLEGGAADHGEDEGGGHGHHDRLVGGEPSRR